MAKKILPEQRSPSLAYYHRNKESRKKKSLEYYHANKEKRNAAAKVWNANNPESLKASRERAKAKKYGLSVTEMRNLLVNKSCAICETRFTNTKHRHIDHCHITGKVRGVICTTCNHALGNMYDRPDLLRKAAQYLEQQNL